VAKLNEIHEQFNQSDVYITRQTYSVGGHSMGEVGKKDGAGLRYSWLPRRKISIYQQGEKSLLVEYNLKGKSGLAAGENDPTVSLETRTLKRITRERRRSNLKACRIQPRGW
jgi:hypothetical protein